nr:hypothetical protein [Tanacetum cinerariifolium]
VKGIGRVSPMKSKVTDKSDSPMHRWIPLSERVSNKPGDIVVNAQPVSQYNPVTGQVVKESDKVQQPKVKSAIDEKDNPKVKSAVAKENSAVVKEKPVVVKEKSVGVTSKVSKGNDDVVKASVVTDKDDVVKASVVAYKVLVVTDKTPVVKVMVADNVVADKEPLKDKPKQKAKEPDSVVGSVFDVVKEIAFDVVNEKASDALKNKATGVKKKSVGKGKKSTVDKPKDKVPNPKDNKSKPNPKKNEKSNVQELSKVPILRSSNQKVNPDVKSKVFVRVSKSKETPVKRKKIVSKEDDRKKKLKGMSKKEDSDSELETETDVVDSSSDEVDRKDLCVNDIARKLVAAKEIDFLFKVNFFTLFTNMMGKADGLKGRAEEKLAVICSERVLLENLIRKASSDYLGDGKFVELQEKYVQVFRDPILFDVDVDAGNDRNGDDDEDDDNDNDSNGNGDEEDVNEGDKDPNRSNPSFRFSKISLDDFRNNSGPTRIKSVDPTKQETIVEVNPPEECELMSTPRNYTQWLDKNANLVGEGDLFGDNSATLEAMNQEITPEKLPTQKASPSPKNELNKKTNVVSKFISPEFILGNSLFSMHGDKMVIQSKSHEIHSESHVIYSEFRVIHFESHSEHFYVVVFSLTKTTAMTILDNSPGTYDSKYKEVCDLLKMLFARHLKQYGHIRHTQVAKVKKTIPKLKWKTKENFHDCGIFAMLHMETFDGGPASNLDCGLLILLHEINVHAGKMLELAKEFDKTDVVEKMVIIVDAFKKREELIV